MKTLKQWNKRTDELSLEQWIKPFEKIDYELYSHILCGYLAPRFDTGYQRINGVDVMYGQQMECDREIDGIRYYATVAQVGNYYYFLGILPAFKKPK